MIAATSALTACDREPGAFAPSAKAPSVVALSHILPDELADVTGAEVCFASFLKNSRMSMNVAPR